MELLFGWMQQSDQFEMKSGPHEILLEAEVTASYNVAVSTSILFFQQSPLSILFPIYLTQTMMRNLSSSITFLNS